MHAYYKVSNKNALGVRFISKSFHRNNGEQVFKVPVLKEVNYQPDKVINLFLIRNWIMGGLY